MIRVIQKRYLRKSANHKLQESMNTIQLFVKKYNQY